MFTLFFRAIFLYGLMIFTMRLLGKRQLGEFEPYELALTILLADIVSSPIESVSTPLLYGIVPIAAVITLHGALSIACVKSDRLRSIISGRPTLIINRGEIDLKELDRLCLSLSDLLEGLRCAGYLDPSEVGTAVIEANGSISAFPKSGKRPPNLEELGLRAAYEGLPMVLIVNGRLQRDNLRAVGKDTKWLEGLLLARRIAPREAALCFIDTGGQMTVQTKGGRPISFQAMAESGVRW